jgi:putative transposase
MPRRARVKSKTGIYHIMWRGANRQEIFHDDEDWPSFIEILKKYKVNCGLFVFAWCLMNNHVHLLIKEGNEDISVSMKRIGVCYVRYYNFKYKTTGHLFQDRFKSEPVEDRKYLFTVVRYIHQNPLKAGMVSKVDEWQWSSCRDYYGMNLNPGKLLDEDYILTKISADKKIAIERFKEFNERIKNDQCLDDEDPEKRLTDEEARQEIKKLIGEIEIAQVKSLPRAKRNEVLKEIKGIRRLSLRQVARILGVSVNLVFKA